MTDAIDLLQAARPGIKHLGEPRRQQDPAISVQIPCRSRTFSGWVEDLSEKGARVVLKGERLDECLDLDVTLALRLAGPDGEVEHRARVLRQSIETGGIRLEVCFVDHLGYDPSAGRLALSEVRIDPGCALRIPQALAQRRQLLPFVELGGTVHLACADPGDLSAIQAVERVVKAPVRPWAVDPEELHQAIQRIYGGALVRSPSSAGPVGQDAVALCDELLYVAYLRQASDIHIDTGPRTARVRLRVDGELESERELTIEQHTELVSRIKVLAGMDIAERRSPQDGRFSHRPRRGAHQVDIRVASLPTKYGERLTLRLLAVQTEALTLEHLGLGESLPIIDAFLRRRQGLMLLTGPTGSGKTTTLYAAIRRLVAERNLNVVTVEDPIEYDIEGVVQCEVDSAEKVTFTKALRSILRHDPDVVMIGEIRDAETADVAIKAALTGHLVLSTLHTNSAAGAVTRLMDMGLAPYLIAATLRLSMAQRLIRRLCSHCRRDRALSQDEAHALGEPALAGSNVAEPVGCLYCGGKGYGGRIGLYESLAVDEDWAALISEGPAEDRLWRRFREHGLVDLRQAALTRLLARETSVADALEAITAW